MAQETSNVDVRLTRLEAQFDSFREEMRSFREEVRTRTDRIETRIDSYFRWTMGLMFAVWGSVIAVVLGTLITQ